MNQTNWVDVALWVVSSLGFVLAVLLSVSEYYRYHLKLHLFVHCYRVHYFGNQESVVFFRLSFVNPASAGRTLNHTSYSKKIVPRGMRNTPIGITWSEPDNQYDIIQNIVTFSLPNGEHQMPADEILQYPLDIPPNQSRTRWLVLVAKVGDIPLGNQPIVFQAFDVFEKKIANKKILIPIENLKHAGMYYPENSSYYSPM